jgi:hypothetical protein
MYQFYSTSYPIHMCSKMTLNAYEKGKNMETIIMNELFLEKSSKQRKSILHNYLLHCSGERM